MRCLVRLPMQRLVRQPMRRLVRAPMSNPRKTTPGVFSRVRQQLFAPIEIKPLQARLPRAATPRRGFVVLPDRLETGRVVLYGLGVGVGVGLAGALLMWLLDVFTHAVLGVVVGIVPPGLPNEGGVMQVFLSNRGLLLVPVLAVAAALAVYAERAVLRHDTPLESDAVNATLEAYHRQGARIPTRQGLAHVAGASLGVVAGAPLGLEGVMSGLTALLGSWFGRLGRLTEEDRRLVFLAAFAAGLGITLRAPLAGAVLAVEMLYRRFDFEIEALTPAVLASVVAYAIFGAFRGFAAPFSLPELSGAPLASLLAFFVLGILEAAAAAGFVMAVRALRTHWAGRFSSPTVLLVAGALVGALALLEPGVLGSGFGWVQLVASGFVPLSALLVLLALRTVATIAAAGSDVRGGLLTPSLVLGALVGAAYALALDAVFPALGLEPAAFALTGAGAFLASTINAPLGATLLITEWTGYGLLVPLLLTSAAGFAITGRESVLEAQSENRASSPVHIQEYLTKAANIAPERAQSDLITSLSQGPVVVGDDDRLYRVPVPKTWVGKAVRELQLPNETLVIAVWRGGHILVPRGGTVLEGEDDVVLMSQEEAFATLGL